MLARSIQSLAESFSESVINIILNAPLSELALSMRQERLDPDVERSLKDALREKIPRRKVVRKKLANKTSKTKTPTLALIHVELEK